MFYIDAQAILRRREILYLQVLPAILVFLAFLIITGVSWSASNNAISQEQQKLLKQKNSETTTYLQQRMIAYEDVLRGGAGLFNASEEVTREEWSRYLATYTITNRYPGVQGIGYIEVISSGQLDAHTSIIRDTDYPTYAVFPIGDRAQYAPIVYLEPASDMNNKAIGYDMYYEPATRQAMEKARDTGRVAISDIVTLIQDSHLTDKQPAFLMYLPIYDRNSPTLSVEQRRSALRGYLYASFRSNELISQAKTAHDQQYGFKIFTSQTNNLEVYKTDNFADLNQISSTKKETANIDLQGKTWKITGSNTPDVVNRGVRSRPLSVLSAGIVFSFVVASYIYLLLKNRARALADKESESIHTAKEELLALASHQLRTPATGVKQYIGMLREGFVGTLTAAQKRLVDKAYASNERQLGTINEILFVARADADQLQLDFTKINITKIIREIVDEQSGEMAKKNLKCTLKIAKKAIHLDADKQYLRMAIENVISNAVKYTKDGGRVTVELQSDSNNVYITVTDSGVGVSETDYPLLFKKFSRIPNELTSHVSGSGIGLYLVRKVMDAHKGSITFKSKPKKGSVVSIKLPVKKQ